MAKASGRGVVMLCGETAGDGRTAVMYYVVLHAEIAAGQACSKGFPWHGLHGFACPRSV